MTDAFVVALLVSGAISTAIFAWAAWRSFVAYQSFMNGAEDGLRRSEHSLEHGLVIASTLLIISAANMVVLATLPPAGLEVHDWGAVIVRGALIAAAIYLVARHPKIGG